MYINQCIPETDFLLSHLTSNMKVLEYGSGGSTKVIAEKVKELISLEHTPEWYDQVKVTIPANVNLVLVDNDAYVEKPLEFIQNGKFDAIFIDGSHRIQCAEFCRYLGHDETKVFVHDYNRDRVPEYNGLALEVRTEYFVIEKHLEPIDGVLTMWRFKIRF